MPSEAAKVLSGAAASGFAKLFAGLTGPKGRDTDARADSRPGSWIDDALAPDVATISYEQALRTHARYRHPDTLPPSVTATDPEVPQPPQSMRIPEWVPGDPVPRFATNRKLASIAIRMSAAECA